LAAEVSFARLLIPDVAEDARFGRIAILRITVQVREDGHAGGDERFDLRAVQGVSEAAVNRGRHVIDGDEVRAGRIGGVAEEDVAADELAV